MIFQIFSDVLNLFEHSSQLLCEGQHDGANIFYCFFKIWTKWTESAVALATSGALRTLLSCSQTKPVQETRQPVCCIQLGINLVQFINAGRLGRAFDCANAAAAITRIIISVRPKKQLLAKLTPSFTVTAVKACSQSEFLSEIEYRRLISG